MNVVKNVQSAAHVRVRRAIKNGQIVRPVLCEWCGKENKIIYSHHEDYFAPLCIEWVCPHCHLLYHLGKNKHHGYPEEWYNLDDICLDTQEDIDNDRNQAFSRYSHDLEINPTIFGRLHNYA